MKAVWVVKDIAIKITSIVEILTKHKYLSNLTGHL